MEVPDGWLSLEFVSYSKNLIKVTKMKSRKTDIYEVYVLADENRRSIPYNYYFVDVYIIIKLYLQEPRRSSG